MQNTNALFRNERIFPEIVTGNEETMPKVYVEGSNHLIVEMFALNDWGICASVEEADLVCFEGVLMYPLNCMERLTLPPTVVEKETGLLSFYTTTRSVYRFLWLVSVEVLSS